MILVIAIAFFATGAACFFFAAQHAANAAWSYRQAQRLLSDSADQHRRAEAIYSTWKDQ